MAASQLTAAEQQIYDALERETSSNNSIQSLTDLAKVFAKVFGSKPLIAGSIEADTIFPSVANVNFHIDFAGSFGGNFNTLLENITLTSSPEKFVIPETGKYLVSYYTTINANQNIKGQLFPTKNNIFLNDYYHTAYGNTYSGISLSNVTFGKSKIMSLNQGDTIGLAGNMGVLVMLGTILQIQKL